MGEGATAPFLERQLHMICQASTGSMVRIGRGPRRRIRSVACILVIAVLAPQIGYGQAAADWHVKSAPLMTRWSADVGPDNVHPEYPRPQMVRPSWKNLNGLWECERAERNATPPFGRSLDRRILVPFPVESALSGVMESGDRWWYRRMFTLPDDWSDRKVILHFGAVDWEARVFVDGMEVGAHQGGYDAFRFDITSALKGEGPHELLVEVYDPTDEGVYPRGKQVGDPSGIFYTSVTGIWQTVWLEAVPAAHITGLDIVTDIDRMMLQLSVETTEAAADHEVHVRVLDGDRVLSTQSGQVHEVMQVHVPEAELWSPDHPALYDMEVQLTLHEEVVDRIQSYFGMRSIAVGPDENGVTRILLNNEPVFQVGPLDQGYWPDGLYTAPTDEALRFDIEAARDMGFNMIRKHAKVEPQRWYYWADRLGMIVWQDMPSVSADGFEERQTEAHREQFERELRALISGFKNHPSIVMWTLFNEGWGQYDTERLTAWIAELDPTRIVTNASGWVDHPVGDVIDMHMYPGPDAFPPEETRASVLGEFGGLGLVVDGHTWSQENNWGYLSVASADELTQRYEHLFEWIWQLKEDPGLSAAVYTQLTDVETETNGLLTYDREHLKVPAETLRGFHREDMTSLPRIRPNGTLFIGSVDIVLDNRNGETIRYTLDGSDPSHTSARYDGPITLTESALLTARSYSSDGRGSGTISAPFERVTRLRPAESPGDLEPGVRFAYYEGEWDWMPAFDSLAPASEGLATAFHLDDRQRDDHFGMRFTGYINVPADGVYSFYTESDDGSLLHIGDELVVDNDGVHGMVESRGQIALEAGLHPITVSFFERLHAEGLIVRFEGPGIGKREIPASALFRQAP